MTPVDIPTPNELDRDPELAVLAALDAALQAAVFALVAVHPPLRGDSDALLGDDTPETYWIASVFVISARQLGDALDAYRNAVDKQRRTTNDEFPF